MFSNFPYRRKFRDSFRADDLDQWLQPENVATKALILSESGDAVSILQERTVTEAAGQFFFCFFDIPRKDVFCRLMRLLICRES